MFAQRHRGPPRHGLAERQRVHAPQRHAPAVGTGERRPGPGAKHMRAGRPERQNLSQRGADGRPVHRCGQGNRRASTPSAFYWLPGSPSPATATTPAASTRQELEPPTASRLRPRCTARRRRPQERPRGSRPSELTLTQALPPPGQARWANRSMRAVEIFRRNNFPGHGPPHTKYSFSFNYIGVLSQVPDERQPVILFVQVTGQARRKDHGIHICASGCRRGGLCGSRSGRTPRHWRFRLGRDPHDRRPACRRFSHHAVR